MPIPFLLYLSIAFIAICVVRRKQAIGGWLLYFYYWIFAVLFISLRDIALHPSAFKPSFGSDSLNREALFLAVFPRLFLFLAVAVIAVMLLIEKEWVWVERLRVVLLAGVFIAGLSVWLDVHYFPKSIRGNAVRWGGLCFWLLYFFVSKRVHHVFRTKDWSTAQEFMGS